jgi:hypothetical protein
MGSKSHQLMRPACLTSRPNDGSNVRPKTNAQDRRPVTMTRMFTNSDPAANPPTNPPHNLTEAHDAAHRDTQAVPSAPRLSAAVVLLRYQSSTGSLHGNVLTGQVVEQEPRARINVGSAQVDLVGTVPVALSAPRVDDETLEQVQMLFPGRSAHKAFAGLSAALRRDEDAVVFIRVQ